MIENVIVTLQYREREFDMELSANVEMTRLKPLIAKALQCKGLENIYITAFESNGRPLKETRTLLEDGVWDGSYLKIV